MRGAQRDDREATACKKEHVLVVDPAGEEQFEFVTPGGRIALRPSDEALTPYGGLVPFAAFRKHLGIVETLLTYMEATKEPLGAVADHFGISRNSLHVCAPQGALTTSLDARQGHHTSVRAWKKHQ